MYSSRITHTLLPALILAAALSPLIGCDDEARLRAGTQPPPNGVDTPPSDDEPTPIDLTPDAPPPPITTPVSPSPTQGLATCAPGAHDYDESEVPELPPELLAGICDGDVNMLEDSVDDGTATQSYTYDRDAHAVIVETRESGGWWSSNTVFELDAAWRPRQVTVKGTGGFYAIEYGTTVYRFDEDGHLTYKLASTSFQPDGPTDRSFEKTQTWSGGRLVERVERDVLANVVTRTWSWDYDGAGRLVQASFARPADGFVQGTTWSYDGDALVELRREVNGVQIEAQTWQWADGRLLGHTYAVEGPNFVAARLGEEPTTATRYAWVAGLDSMESTSLDWMTPDPWAPASTLALSDGPDGPCRNLPRGAGHGYPLDEGLHDLGVAPGERPHGIGFAYGYAGYGWMYGDDAWYGHAGVSTMWPGYDGGWAQAVAGVVSYDEQGRMIGESMTVQESWEGTSYELVRTRSFEAELVEDEALFVAGESSLRRTLRYQLDTAGRLVARDLYEEGRVLQGQTWSYDGAGRLVAHEMRFDGASGADERWAFFDSWSTPMGTDLSGLYWAYDAAGRLIERGTNGGHRERITYDDDGRVVEREGAFAHYDSGNLVTYAYDEAGRLVRECTEVISGAYPTTCTVTEYDPNGRLLRVLSQSEDTTRVLQARAYACAP